MSNQRKFNNHEVILKLLTTTLEHDNQQEALSDLTFELVEAVGYLVGSTDKLEDREIFIRKINSQINDCVEMLDGVRKELASNTATLEA
jgi:hypothetical protein